MVAAARQTLVQRWVECLAHPCLLLGAYLLWEAMDRGGGAVFVALAGAFSVLMLLEHFMPAMPGWRLGPRQRLVLTGLYLMTFVLFGVMAAAYEATLANPLAPARESLGLGWSGNLPMIAQVLLLFFASDLLYYWIHRAIHRWGWLWKASGHGFHHAFQNLHALNVGATHPFEIVLLALPMVLVAALSGASGEAVGGATVLVVVNTAAAHANVRMDTPVLNWFFTSANQHRRHHSRVFEDSNTNYACNAILWDRLFGTFSRGEVEQTGIGPFEPSLGQKFMLPFREPAFADTAATRAHRRDQPA
ncbi:sterol desaturase family protein [Arenimonas sp.]|uniref:sterol desaturase family protein n=1 Tax=Arenimonas sp. TaxID=1872635 RepID=UPI0025E00A25|nr:sterol desaturase family protein [Arenimonas sp.]